MDTVLTEWLAGMGWRAFTWSLAGLLLLNGAAAIAFVLQGSRGLVQRWTSVWLAGNLLLLAVGIGVPATTSTARVVVSVAQLSVPTSVWADAETPARETR